jgi:Tfp pilus assembly protein PilX
MSAPSISPPVLPPARRSSEDGYVLIVVLGLLMVALTIGAAALALTLSSNKLTLHEMRLRRAQQAADAGIQAQLYNQSEADLGSSAYNLNGGAIGLGTFLDCTVPKLNSSLQVSGVASVAASSAGVCPSAVGSGGAGVTSNQVPVGNHTTYQSEMLTGQANFLSGTIISGQNGSAMRELSPKIVSIGAESSTIPAGSGTVYSREEAILAPIAPLQAIEGENNVTIGGLKLLGVPVTGALNGDVLARNDLTTPGGFAAVNLSNGLIGTLTYGGHLSGGGLANAVQVSPSSIIARPTVSISPSKANCSVTANCTALGAAYNSAKDTFSLASGSVTFAAGDYVFCSFNATGGTVNINPTVSVPVRIFIDSPSSSRCAADTGDPQKGNFNDVAGFNNQLLGTGGVLASSGMQVYVVGNGTGGGTTVQIGPTSTSGLLSLSAVTYGGIVYAPTSNVTANVPALCVLSCSLLSSGGTFEGALVGYNTTVDALTISQDLNIGNYPLYAGVNAFRVTEYVQCDDSVHALTQTTADTSGC